MIQFLRTPSPFSPAALNVLASALVELTLIPLTFESSPTLLVHVIPDTAGNSSLWRVTNGVKALARGSLRILRDEGGSEGGECDVEFVPVALDPVDISLEVGDIRGIPLRPDPMAFIFVVFVVPNRETRFGFLLSFTSDQTPGGTLVSKDGDPIPSSFKLS